MRIPRSHSALPLPALLLCLHLCVTLAQAQPFLESPSLTGPPAGSAQAADAQLAAMFREHCIRCHGQDDLTEADVDLRNWVQQSPTPELLQDLVRVLDAGTMPPEDEPQPDTNTRSAATARLHQLLRQAAAGTAVRTPVRRLNRFQYNNAVIDLFDLNCIVFTLPERVMRVHKDYFQPASGKMPARVTVGNRPLGKSQMIEPRLAGVAAFPQDLRAEHGYDNQADHLSLSPLLLQALLELGNSITQSPDFGPETVGIWDQFFATPTAGTDIETAIADRLGPFLNRAFRGAVSPKVELRYQQFALAELQRGQPFPQVMKRVAAATLASPRFLYRYQRAPPALEENSINTEQSDDPRMLDDRELASRLSFFLWGSLPDEELLQLAQQGQLSEADVLSAQVERMLRDRRLKRFCDSFPAQWLQLERLISSTPDRQQFPEFYYLKYRTSMHMMLEPLLLFETVLIEDRPIIDLIAPDFTYRSAKLTHAYGALAGSDGSSKKPGGGVAALTFRRTPLNDRRTGGVITNAAVMTMTSGPQRTQPITRGAWVAGVIFNDPPKPPPADVPALPAKPQAGEENWTLRERLAAHRQRADCRGCHEQIDPLGFALENFDPVGRWRDTYANGRQVDASGQLFQEPFADLIQFKSAISAAPQRFCRALAGHLLSFALARHLVPADEIALDAITAAVAEDGYKMQTLIRQIVLSQPFRTKP